MFESIKRSWALTKETFKVLKNNKKLILFPLLSCISAIIVIASFLIPLFWSKLIGIEESNGINLIIIFAYYFALYFVSIFFNVALISEVKQALQKKPVSLTRGIGTAFGNLIPIIIWTLIASTVGMILNSIKSEKNFVASIIAAILGGAWTLLTFFVVPVMIFEKKNPIDSLKRSFELIKKSWGENLIVGTGLGIITFLLVIIGIIGFILILILLGPIAVFLLPIWIFFIITAVLVMGALNTIFIAVLYEYAISKTTPEGIKTEIISSAFTSNKK